MAAINYRIRVWSSQGKPHSGLTPHNPPCMQDKMSEMLAQRVEGADPGFDDPYEDVCSAKSLSSSSNNSPFSESDSRDNILQLLETG